ncbi:Nose resistant-to-fluoxetine protein, N-terminal,Acyltransferase 3 [Cinara cedri]|uniref:Nose resistant-to-fluoxetine protein, N-terminal,Acyltransferase 3 n=1 Tax=Cinara cedri TaxID=506608 RepID=A0A5E4NK28_9HEMI|nr:Nose resistant-to-fluoxetine protein, N-terminal,Acyltransferase 3 [Cinara cedri]
MYSVVIISLCGLVATYGQITYQEPSVVPSVVSLDDADTPSAWISDLLYQGLANFSVRNVGSTACRRQTEMYERNLQNYTSWAVRMAESWDRRPVGILAGNRYHLGVYDECVDIEFPVRGQYCIPEVNIVTATGKDFRFNRTDDMNYYGINHAWNTILGWIDYPDQVQRNVMHIGICIPDSCTAHDLQISLQKELDNVLLTEQVKAFVKVNPITCTVSGDMYSYDTGYYITTSLLIILILVCFGATIHHFVALSYYKNNKDAHVEPDSIYYSFSFIKSSRELLKFDKNNELNYINGFKVIVMLGVLFGHRAMFFLGNPFSVSKFVENFFLDGPKILKSGMNIVDPFFFITGYLTYFTVYPTFSKPGPGWLKFVSPIVYRIFKMLPAYCVIMAVTAYIVPHAGDGPFWPQNIWQEAENCKNYWWTNLLFISNFIDVKNQCLLISWYLSCDIQFFIVGVIILYIYSKNKKSGIGLLSVLLCISFCIPFIITLLTNRDSIVKLNLPFLKNPRSSSTFSDSYRPSYMRAIPFFLGLTMGFIGPKLKERNIRFSQITVFVGTSIAIVICLYVQFYGNIFYQRNRPYYSIEQALYASLNHCTWTGLGIVIYIFNITSGYGLLMKVLSNRLIIPLGRLSYSVFLVNLIVMMMSQSTQRLPNYASMDNMIRVVIQDVFKTYLMALSLYLVVEAPFGNLIRLLFGRGPKKCSSEDSNEIPHKPTISLEFQNKEISHL